MIIRIRESIALRLLTAKTGKEWDIVVISAGYSKNKDPYGNRFFYPAQTLARDYRKFDGVPVRVYEFNGRAPFDHLPQEVKDGLPQGCVGNTIAMLRDPRFVELEEGEQAIIARMYMLDGNERYRDMLRDAWEQGLQIAGFSIDASGQSVIENRRGVRSKVITSIESVDSVDLVSYPARGGRFHRLVASVQGREDDMLLKIIEAIRKHRAAMLAGFDVNGLQESDASDMLTQILEAQRERMLSDLGKAKGERFTEQAEAIAMLQNIMQLLADGNVEEAMAAVQTWLDKLAGEGGEGGQQSQKKTEPEPKREPVQQQQAAVPSNNDAVVAELIQQNQATTNVVKELQGEIAQGKADQKLGEALAGSKLPDICQTQIKTMFASQQPTDAKIQEAIAGQKDLLAALSPSGRVVGHGAVVEVGKEEMDRFRDAMDGMITGRMVNKVIPFCSLHESYRLITGRSGSRADIGRELLQHMAWALPGMPGHEEVFEQHHIMLRESAPSFSGPLREALATTDWPEIFGDSIRRALIREYQEFRPEWRDVVSGVVPVQDFRENIRIRVGGIADLADVAELGTYPEIAEPTDEAEKYTVGKKGGLFTISMETVVNDDLGKIRQIPVMLGRAAARTISKAVLKTNLSDNPLLVSDGVALIDSATHKNDVAAALSEASLQDAIELILKAEEKDTGERLGLMPKLLVIPPDLQSLGWELINSRIKISGGAGPITGIPSNIREFYGMQLVLNLWQTSATRWQIIADPARNPTMEVGFLGGRQNPEVFVADQPAIGSMLTADKIVYKIRYIFGVVVLDFRTFAGSAT